MLTKEKSSQNSEDTTVLRITPPRGFPRTPCIPVTYHLKEAEKHRMCSIWPLSLAFPLCQIFCKSKSRLIIQAIRVGCFMLRLM